MDPTTAPFVPTTTDKKNQNSDLRVTPMQPTVLRMDAPDPYPHLPHDLFGMAVFDFEFLRTVSKKAENETWSSGFSILSNLLAIQFQILRRQPGGLPKLRTGEILMNTSLLQRYKFPACPLYIAFTPSQCTESGQDAKPFTVSTMSANDQRIEPGYEPPLANWYPPDLSVIVWDRHLPISVDYSHILDDNASRFPEKFRGDSFQTLKGRFILSIEHSIEKCRRRPYIPVPMLFMPSGKISNATIQLLLPLYFGEEDQSQLAVVIERLEFGYRVATILPIATAYSNARALGKLDGTWLQYGNQQNK